MSKFDFYACANVFKVWKKIIEAKRIEAKRHFILWVKFTASKVEKKEFLSAKKEKVAFIQRKVSFKGWKMLFLQRTFAKRGLSALSNTLLARRHLHTWKDAAKSQSNLKKASTLLSMNLAQLKRRVFIGWKAHVAYVKRETQRLRKLRIARTKADSIAQQKSKQLVFMALREWEDRVMHWVRKREVNKDCDTFREFTVKTSAMRRLRVVGMKNKSKKRAGE